MFASPSEKLTYIKARLDEALKSAKRGQTMHVPLSDLNAPDEVINTLIILYEREGVKAWIEKDVLHVKR